MSTLGLGRRLFLSMRLLAGLLIGGLLLGGVCLGCGSAPVVHYYTLTPPSDQMLQSVRSTGIVLGVEPFRVDPPFNRQELVYRMGEGSAEVGFYSYHRWAAPLGHLVMVALVEGLRGAPGLASVEPVSLDGGDDAVLRGRVVRAEELDSPRGQEAHLELEFQLIIQGEVRWEGRLRGSAEGQVETVDGIVVLLGKALEEVIANLRLELTQELASLKVP